LAMPDGNPINLSAAIYGFAAASKQIVSKR
jgi:hypothetical protein